MRAKFLNDQNFGKFDNNLNFKCSLEKMIRRQWNVPMNYKDAKF